MPELICAMNSSLFILSNYFLSLFLSLIVSLLMSFALSSSFFFNTLYNFAASCTSYLSNLATSIDPTRWFTLLRLLLALKSKYLKPNTNISYFFASSSVVLGSSLTSCLYHNSLLYVADVLVTTLSIYAISCIYFFCWAVRVISTPK